MTPWLGRSGFGDAPTSAIVFASPRSQRKCARVERYPQTGDPGRPLRRRLHARPSRSRARARRLPAARRAARARARPRALRGARPGVRAAQRHPDLDHDDEIWVAFTERIVRGMGGDAEARAACAADIVRALGAARELHLYEDALPVLEELRRTASGSVWSRTAAATSTSSSPTTRSTSTPPRLARVRPHEAASVRSSRRALSARRRAAGGSDGGRLLRRRHRRGARARHARVPARPRRPLPGRARPAARRCSRCPRRWN